MTYRSTALSNQSSTTLLRPLTPSTPRLCQADPAHTTHGFKTGLLTKSKNGRKIEKRLSEILIFRK